MDHHRQPLPPPPPPRASSATPTPTNAYPPLPNIPGWNDPPETLFSSGHKGPRRAVRPPITSSHSSPTLARPIGPYAHSQSNQSQPQVGVLPRPGPYSNYPTTRTLPTALHNQPSSRSVEQFSSYPSKALPALPQAPPNSGPQHSPYLRQAPDSRPIAQNSGFVYREAANGVQDQRVVVRPAMQAQGRSSEGNVSESTA